MKKILIQRYKAIFQIALAAVCLLIVSTSVVPGQAIAQQVSTPSPEPLVAVHVSELTQALEAMPAVPPTPTGEGTTGNQWWYTTWHYFVAYESLKEALRSDGIPFVVISDSDIAAGKLLHSDGTPRYPILISLTAEAIADTEISPLREYVNAGGFLFAGSSAFTRNPDGTTRGDFALASEMGLHMATSSLFDDYTNNHFKKTFDHRLTSHIPSGNLVWNVPLSSEEIPWGVSPAHVIHGNHYAWKVVASGATVLANGDAGPLLTVNNYGQGAFIYHGAFQPLIGHGGDDPGMYAYLIFRKAIEWAFESFGLPILKVNPWPYQYDAAFIVRHDFENIPSLIQSIKSSAQFEQTLGVKGDYFFCTGALRDDMLGDAVTVADLQSAVSNFGATIGSHNGGLKNPVNSSLLPGDMDYWHWGPDEALDTSPEGYADGKAYATASILASFTDIEGWLAGLDNGRTGCGTAQNCPRLWAGPYFNSTRDDSNDIVDDLGAVVMGEQKIGPFPHKTLSYKTPGKYYAPLTLPVSDWYVGTTIAQDLELHTVQSIQAAVDFYFSIGGFINFYGHAPSNNGSVEQAYVTYAASNPGIWKTNSIGIYDWWMARSNIAIAPAFSMTGSIASIQATITGSTDANSSVGIIIPNWSNEVQNTVQVLRNNTSATAGDYSFTEYGVKVKVGSGTSSVEVRYVPAPLSSLSVSPASVIGGVIAQGTVTLSGPAPVGGVEISLSSDTPSAADVPVTVTVPAGSTSATFTATTFPVVSSTPATISAVFSGVTKTATLTVDPAALSTLSVNPAGVVGGIISQGTVTLTGAAPAGGVTVALSSDTPSAAGVPVTVTVPAGSTSATFTITTTPVASSTPVTITALYSGVTKTATLTVNPAALSTLSVNPASVVGGIISQGTVTLTGAAPAGGVTVALSSGVPSAAGVPTSVLVLAGSTSATFTITTYPVAGSIPAIITADFSGVTKTATLTVNPAALSTLSVSPASVVGGIISQGTVTLSGPAPSGGVAVSLSSNTPSAASIPAAVLVPAGSTSAAFTITTYPVASSTPVTISANYGGILTAVLTVTPPALNSLSVSPTSVLGGLISQGTVTLTGAAPAGGVAVSLSSDTPSAAGVPALVTVPAGSTSATFTITTYPVAGSTAVTISAVYSGVTKTATLTVTPTALSSFSVSPASVLGGIISQGTVTLTGAAPSGGVAVSLSSDTPLAASAPSTVTVPAGSTSAAFTITTYPVAGSTPVTISANYGGILTAVLTVTPPALSSLSVSPASVLGGIISQGTVTLTGAAPAGGVAVSLSSDTPSAAVVPALVTVLAGSTSATFTITTYPVVSSTLVAISADYSGVKKTAELTVTPPALNSFSVSPASVLGGINSQGSVTLTGAAPTGGVAISLQGNSPAVSVPALVTVPAGSASAAFTITTYPVAGSIPVIITADFSGVTKTATLTVTPPALNSFSVSPASAVGGAASQGTVALNGAAPAGGVTVALSSGVPSAAGVPALIMVPAGSTSFAFTITTYPVAGSTPVIITADYGGVTKTATLTVTPPALNSFSVSPASVVGGIISQGTVALNGPAPSGGVVVSLSENSSAASVPATVTVPAGSTSAAFTITTYPVVGSTAVTVSANYGSILTAALTVTPPDGDFFGDGVKVEDALKALRIASGIDAATTSDLIHGDVAPMVNGIPHPDGKIDINDVVVILRKAAGLTNW